jgi:hypothetical protein
LKKTGKTPGANQKTFGTLGHGRQAANATPEQPGWEGCFKMR